MSIRAMKLFSNLNEEYFYSGEEFEDDLLKSKAWEAEKTGRNKYRVFPHVSVGTLFINHIPIPIKVNVELIGSESGSESVLLSTNIRPEHYFIFVLFASACTIIPLAFKKDAWVVIYPLVLWFPFHAFFQFVIRVQEEMLVNNITNKLRLKPLP